MGVFVDRTGKRYGRLTVLSRHGSKNNRAVWKCRCNCGKIVFADSSNLVIGDKKSCGCLYKETRKGGVKNTTHGHKKNNKESVTYRTWVNMRARCNNPNETGYEYYGGRGIKVCREWENSFEAFLRDMGCKPTGLTIERIDVNGNYNKSNCKWATTKEQSLNRRNSIRR